MLARLPSPHLLASGLLGFAAIGLTAAAQGAYFPPAWGWSAVGLLLAAGLGLSFRARVELTRLQYVFLGGITSVLAWIALSNTWSASVPRTVGEVERSTIYVAAAAALFAVASRESLPFFFGGIAAAVVAVSAYALLDRIGSPPQGHPLSGPLGYWNALGILSAIALILAVGFASGRLPVAVRLAALASLPLLAVTLALTHSRGSLLGLAAGLLATVFLHPWLARGRRFVALAAAVLALGGLGAATVSAGGPGALLGKSYGAFRSAPAPQGKSSERILTLSGNFRSQYWHVAWQEYRAHPWLGSGAGTYDLYWDKNRNTIYGALDAHNLYLETLAELGPFGLLLLGGTLALPFLALRRARGDALLAAAVGGYVAFLVHATFDWDWEIPAVTLAGLFCGAGAVALAPGRLRPLSGAARGVALGVLAIFAAFALVAYRGNTVQDASVKAAGRGDFVRAKETARTAARWMPWSSEAWRLRGEAELALGDTQEARTSFRLGLAKDPHEWTLWYDLALASKGRERQRAIDEAARLNQYSIEVRALRGQ